MLSETIYVTRKFTRRQNVLEEEWGIVTSWSDKQFKFKGIVIGLNWVSYMSVSSDVIKLRSEDEMAFNRRNIHRFFYGFLLANNGHDASQVMLMLEGTAVT